MRVDIEERVKKEAEYIIKNKATIRATGKYFGYSKSTIYRDIVEKLPRINFSLFKTVKDVMKHNKDIRHIRGGMATKIKFKGESEVEGE